MATTKTNDYLRYSADSALEFLTMKLLEDGKFSDQLYPDSNLSILIDLFAHYYELIFYNLNHAAAESIFTDSQYYENINRIVKLLRYNPRGYITSTVVALLKVKSGQSLSNLANTNWIIPKFTTVTISDKQDALGNSITYTFIKDYKFIAENGIKIDNKYPPILYNGSWKLYPEIKIATGIPFETFFLDKVNYDLTTIAHPFIYAYIKKSSGEYEEYTPTVNLFEASKTDKVFELRINESKQYEMKFGDGIHGKKLDEKDVVYFIYLQSNGKDGTISIGDINENSKLEIAKINGLKTDFVLNNLLKVQYNSYISQTDLNKLYLYNNQVSTNISEMETVEDIRNNAPNWFKLSGKLTTEDDFRNYILMNLAKNNEIHDVSVMNNYEYMKEFFGWLYKFDKINNDIRYFGYKFADAVDFNNIYVWCKSSSEEGYNISETSKRVLETELNKLKPLTSELVFLDPILVNFIPYCNITEKQAGISDSNKYYIPSWEELLNLINDYRHQIVIYRDVNSYITIETLRRQVFQIIIDFFSVSNNLLGQTVDISKLYQNLLNIDGIKDIKTRFIRDENDKSTEVLFDGLSFACWSPMLVQGEDFTVINGNIKLNKFQFPFLLDRSGLMQRIRVFSENYKINPVEY